jgi:alanyl-tRNA synthetase
MRQRGLPARTRSLKVLVDPCSARSVSLTKRTPRIGVVSAPGRTSPTSSPVRVASKNIRAAGDGKGDFPILGELPTKNIDTGLGPDRMAAMRQGVDTILPADLLAPTLATVQDLTGREFPGRDGSDALVSFQVITEHARSIAFLIADGVLPSNEGRGYGLRQGRHRVGLDHSAGPEL